jgi:hypothetical protein
MFGDDFDTPALDKAVWLPHHLPAWSSRAATRAAYPLGDSCLTLSIHPDQGLWCRDEPPTPLRVGWLPTQETIALRARMTLSHPSMAALWLSGFEDEPTRSGKLCIAESFGKDLEGRSAEVGMGLKRLGDPYLAQDFDAPRLPIDVTEFHTYAAT